jgi:hypothetical protein
MLLMLLSHTPIPVPADWHGPWWSAKASATALLSKIVLLWLLLMLLLLPPADRHRPWWSSGGVDTTSLQHLVLSKHYTHHAAAAAACRPALPLVVRRRCQQAGRCPPPTLTRPWTRQRAKSTRSTRPRVRPLYLPEDLDLDLDLGPSQ